MYTRIRVLAVLFATVLAALGLAAPASAEVKVVHDKAGDGSNGAGDSGAHKWGDIGKVRIKHGPYNVKLTVLPAEGGQAADFYDFWVDTDAKDPGPEYVGTISLETVPEAGVAHTGRFGSFGKTSCTVHTATFDSKTQSARVVFPRRCFGKPARIRVSTQTSMEYENADWAPARRTFSPWVKRA